MEETTLWNVLSLMASTEANMQARCLDDLNKRFIVDQDKYSKTLEAAFNYISDLQSKEQE